MMCAVRGCLTERKSFHSSSNFTDTLHTFVGRRGRGCPRDSTGRRRRTRRPLDAGFVRRGTGAARGPQIVTTCSSEQTAPNDVWRGDPALPTHKQGIIVFGTPLGCVDFVEAQFAEKTEEHGILLERIPKVSDLQCAWLLLLFCAASRASYILRVVHPEHSFQFALRHDAGIRQHHNGQHSASTGGNVQIGMEPLWTRRTKERTCPELTGEHGRARFVVLACETGGRWSEESHSFPNH